MANILYKKDQGKWLLLTVVIALLSSCISPKQTNLLQPNKKPFYSVKPYEDYKLQVNDEIYCNILTTNTEFTEEFAQAFTGIISSSVNGTGTQQTAYVIYNNGNISIPFFGDIKIEGLTIPEAEQAIQRKMRSSFPDAQVRVRLKNNFFYVVSGNKNGVYTIYKDNMTIYQAISLSGNIADDVDLSKVKIVRLGKDGESSIVKTFDLKTESVIESEFYYIQPNDVIYYTTSNSSFFKVRSFMELFTTILTPITFLIAMIAIKDI